MRSAIQNYYKARPGQMRCGETKTVILYTLLYIITRITMRLLSYTYNYVHVYSTAVNL